MKGYLTLTTLVYIRPYMASSSQFILQVLAYCVFASLANKLIDDAYTRL